MANTKLPTYRLEFETPYVLSENINFYELYIGDRFSHMNINFHEFRKDYLVYNAQQKGQRKEDVSIWITPSHVDINCSCFSEESFFCRHIYSVLSEITYPKKDFFKIFAPGNLIGLALKNTKLFHKNINSSRNFIMPDASLGALYETDEIRIIEFENIPEEKTCLNQQEHQSKRLAWLVVHSEGRAFKTFPVLVPLLESLNKNGVPLKRFGKGFEDIKREDFRLSDQKELYRICQSMIANAKKRVEYYYDDLYEVSEDFLQCFHNWQNAWPLIAREKNIYHSRMGKLRYFMRQKPMPKYINEITISDEPVQLQFTLKNKGRYYQLSLSFTVNGKPIPNPEIKGMFFISTENKCYYMLSSIQDVIFAHWMARHAFTMSVFKENFEDFEKEVLTIITRYYEIVRK